LTDDEIELLIRKIVEKTVNGGSKCLKGKEIEGKVDSIQNELKEEKADRKKTDTTVFNKLDKTKLEISQEVRDNIEDVKKGTRWAIGISVSIVLTLIGYGFALFKVLL